MTGEASDINSSPNSNTVEYFINAEDRFFDRAREAEGDYASELIDEGDGFTQDDSTAITTYAEDVLKTMKPAQVSASFGCPGIRREYAIGDVISRVQGREISLNRLSADSGESTYLQVVGITFTSDNGEQWTHLTMEHYDS